MKGLRPFAAFAFLLLSTLAIQAASHADYQTGKLVDLRRYETDNGGARAQGSFCLAVQVGDLTYLARHEATWRWSYEPTDLIVGDPVEVKIKGDDLYVQKPKGGELKTRITRRERNTPDAKPITCALPVATQ